MSNAQLNYQLLAAAVERMPSDALTAARQSALAQFGTFGLPDARHEDWKYTNLAPIATLGNAWLAGDTADRDNGVTAGTLESRLRNEVDAYWITLANGRIQSDETLGRLREKGVHVALLTDSVHTADLSADDGLGHLNLALLRDGLRITATANTALDKPLGLLFADVAEAESVTQERIVIHVENNASLQLLECYVLHSTHPGFTNAVLQIDLGESSKVEHVRLQNTGEQYMLVNKTHATLAAHSHYSHACYDFGGRLIRGDFVADINGHDAHVNMRGLYLASGNQHVDNHTTVNHRVGPASSDEEFRGILNGHSRCVFNGKAIVFAGADGTDAKQSNHNLLLSESAEVDTKPELEIYADDVKCSHGATVGQLDEASLFYLRSRGISHEDAVQMLTRAFAVGIIDAAPIAGFRDFLAGLLDRKLNQMAVSP